MHLFSNQAGEPKLRGNNETTFIPAGYYKYPLTQNRGAQLFQNQLASTSRQGLNDNAACQQCSLIENVNTKKGC